MIITIYLDAPSSEQTVLSPNLRAKLFAQDKTLKNKLGVNHTFKVKGIGWANPEFVSKVVFKKNNQSVKESIVTIKHSLILLNQEREIYITDQ